MVLSLNEKILIVQTYYQNNLSVIRTFRALAGVLNPVPSARRIRHIVDLFERNGSLIDNRLQPNEERGNHVRNAATIDIVHNAITRHPQQSVRKLSAEINLPKTTVHKILRKDLSLKPFKTQMVQQLLPQDHNSRLIFSQWVTQKILNQPDFLDNLIVTDEAHFHLNGAVNKQNDRDWQRNNPRNFNEAMLNPPRVTVWIGVTSTTLIGPYFFEENNETVTVNGVRYRAMLEHYVLPEVRRKRIRVRRLWFQQDGAPPHIARPIMEFLRNTFGDRIIS